MVSRYTPLIIVSLALVLGILTFYGEGSYAALETLREQLRTEKDKNREARTQVDKLKQDVWLLKKDDRTIEKAAREKLGLARPDEKIFIFKDR